MTTAPPPRPVIFAEQPPGTVPILLADLSSMHALANSVVLSLEYAVSHTDDMMRPALNAARELRQRLASRMRGTP